MWHRSAPQLVRAAHTVAVRAGLPIAAPAARRALHVARACMSADRKTPASSFADLDDLFGEEQATSMSPSGKGAAATSRLTKTLRDTRVSTQASAAAHAAASSSESAAHSLDESLQLLSAKNPPKLEPKHMQLLRVAQRELEKKLEKATATEIEVNPSVFPPTNPNIEHLSKRLALCRSLVSALFPPEIASVPFDEESTADILDYAESMPGVLNVMTPDAVDPMKLMVIDHKTTRKNRHIYCLFCKADTARLEKNQLVYTNLNLLTQFVNERGMVLQRAESRLCMVHQRKMARTIKRARNIGLLSPSSNWRVDPEFVYGAAAKDFNPHSAGVIAHSSVRGFGLNKSQQQRTDRGEKVTPTSASAAAPTSTLEEDLFADR